MLAAGTKPVSTSEKSRALEQVLASRTFRRCDQLKKILSYVCNKELQEPGGEITEYLIGVEALGRGKDFSPAGDSSVRACAHALRKKLQEYYLVESPEAEVRIEFPKGDYVPQYVCWHGPEPATWAVSETAPPARRRWRISLGQAIAAAVLLMIGVVGYLFRQPLVTQIMLARIPGVIKEAWGPLMDGDEVLVVVATPPQLTLRDYHGLPRPEYPPWWPQIKQTPEILQFYSRHQPVTGDTSLLFYPNQVSPLWGDAAAAMSAVGELAGYGIHYRILPEHLLQPYLLVNRNVLLFGRSEYSETVRLLTKDLPFAIDFEPASRTWLVRNRLAKQGDGFSEVRGDYNTQGLVTVIRNSTPGSPNKRTMIISGATTAGTLAAQEFLSTPDALRDLSGRFRRDGTRKWPTSWQLVVTADISKNEFTVPMNYRYAAHRVLHD
jgi:hypothetical protein